MRNIAEFFDAHNDDYLEFELVENKRSNRPDLHAFLLLDSIVSGKFDIISSAEHDEIFLEVETEALNNFATDDQLIELIRCGVRLSDGYLAMFV